MAFDFSYIDKAFINGNVITVDSDDSIVEAMGIKGRHIVFVGKTVDLLKLVDEKSEIIDLEGRTLMPGMIDTHFHPILNGFIGEGLDNAIVDIDFQYIKSLKALLECVEKVVALKKPGEWMSSMGYEPMFFPERRHPTLKELDAISPDNPVQLMHKSGHISMYNTNALHQLGIYSPEDAKRFPQGEVDVKDGELTGILKENTHFLLWAKVAYDEETQKKAALNSQDQLLKNGITSVHDCGACDAPSYHVMQKITRSGEFVVRSYMYLHSIFGKSFSDEDNKHWLALGLMSGLGDERFKIGGCKFMLDGGSGAPSCATREPFSHDPDLKGVLAWEREETANYIKMINDAECQSTAHAIGDLAIEYMVDGYERAFATNPRPDLRHRIEHCTVTDVDLIKRMAKMNICPTLNSGMFTFQGKHYAEIYGPERNKHLIALRTMLDYGMKPSLASDSPSGPLGLAVIDGAVNRYDRKTDYTFDQTEAISLLEAIRCATFNGAYQAYEEDIKGSLEVGKLADFITLSHNILSIPTMTFNEVEVDATYIDGVCCYKR